MSLVEHARRELALCGQTAEDPVYAESIVKAVEAFASYGHSGGSAEIARAQLQKLLAFESLSPLTDAQDEWVDRSAMCGEAWWQNVRNSRAMSHDGGKTYWLVGDELKTVQHSLPARLAVAA